MKQLIITAAVLAAFAGCTTTSPDVVQRGDAQQRFAV